MASNTQVFAKHSLNTSSLETLSHDLSVRLNAAIDFGFRNDCHHLPDGKYSEDFIRLGTVVSGDSDTYILTETDYALKKLALDKTFVHGLEEQPRQWLLDDAAQASKTIQYELCLKSDTIAIIYPNNVELEPWNGMDRRSFADQFLYKSDRGPIMEWRQQIYRWVTIFGGSDVLADDESTNLSEWIKLHPWPKILDLVAQKYDGRILNIPRHLKTVSEDDKFIRSDGPLPSEYFRWLRFTKMMNLDFSTPHVAYPKVYYDDFSDFSATTSDSRFQVDFPVAPEPKPISYPKITRKKNKFSLPNGSFKVFDGLVAGLQYYSLSQIELKLQYNQELILVREPDNKYDRSAIAVYVEDETVRYKLGFIPTPHNSSGSSYRQWHCVPVFCIRD